MNLVALYIIFTIITLGIIALYFFYLRKSKKIPQTDTLFTDALNAMISGNDSKAILLLRQVVKQDTNHVKAYLQLGNLLRKENSEQAIKIHQSLTVRPNLNSDLKVDIHKSLAKDYIEIGYIENAIKEAKEILTLEKRNLWAIEFLIKTAEDDQNWEEAAVWSRHLQKVTGKKKTDNVARFDVYKGLDSFGNGEFDEAKSFFKKAIKISPNYNLSFRYLGDVYEKKRDLVKAVENWQIYATKELELGVSVYHKIESALFDLGRYSEVENFYRKIIDLDKGNLEAVIKLANVLEEKGETDSALSLIEDSIKNGNRDIRADIMKLKLSLQIATPLDLGHQIDLIINKLSKNDND
ncbi:MAG: hypothetical protein CMG55_08705 [Candidatus Marinimicrobia bacterium]|nr:hypothetical protein [Candidatus Neomarinimicrobiota bacterium]